MDNHNGYRAAEDELGTGPTWKKCLGRALDCAKLAPSLCWGIMSAFAAPAYGAMGWYTSSVVSIVSTGIAIAFGYEVIMYHRRFKYVVAGEYLLGWDQVKGDYSKIKLAVATFFLVGFTVLTILLLHTWYSYIEPCDARYNDGWVPSKKVGGTWVPGHAIDNSTSGCPSNLHPAPCDGACEQCPEDPDCRKWTTFMMDQESMISICGPAKAEYEGVIADYMCLADV